VLYIACMYCGGDRRQERQDRTLARTMTEEPLSLSHSGASEGAG
jgi:hypothetical protein